MVRNGWVSMLLVFLFFIPELSGQVTFVIESLPYTTPKKDTIFISGTFNNWDTQDEKYMLRPQMDGTYSITLKPGSGKIEYKFTRGSWLKVETNKKNEYIQNRVFEYGNGAKVIVNIENWLDLGGVKRFNYVMLFLFSAVVYGLFLIFLVYRIEKKNYVKYRNFLFFNGLIILALLGGVIYYQSNFIWQARISLIAYLATLVWGPFLCLYLCSLLNIRGIIKVYLHYIPLIFFTILAFLILINFKPLQVLAFQINQYLTLEHVIFFGFSIVFNIFYHFKIFQKVKMHFQSDDRFGMEKKFVKVLFFMSLLNLFVLSSSFVLLLFEIQWTWFNDFEFVLVTASFMLLVQLYYFWNYPELVRLKGSPQIIGNLQYLVQRIEQVMMIEKPYKNPDLNIAELSEILESKPHLISKVINDYYHKNYRDFINEYRINEFIRVFKSKEYKNFTFLALANEVGFNSKSTFNLAFKKYTKQSPREFFRIK